MSTEAVNASEFVQRGGFEDWRYLLNRIETIFRAGSFEDAAGFIQRIGEAAETARHHPDIDLRYPDLVHVALTTHSADGLTEADLDLARTISGMAAEAGMTAEPLVSQTVEIAIDAMDIEAVRPFWREVLGYVEVPGYPHDLVDPRRLGPAIWFQQMDEPRSQRKRIHLDICVPHDLADQRVAAAVDAGGTLVSDDEARAFWVLADAEGNEVCITTWQDRD
jgi:4a-hydroxytetrahydrobiopterin dehydratase